MIWQDNMCNGARETSQSRRHLGCNACTLIAIERTTQTHTCQRKREQSFDFWTPTGKSNCEILVVLDAPQKQLIMKWTRSSNLQGIRCFVAIGYGSDRSMVAAEADQPTTGTWKFSRVYQDESWADLLLFLEVGVLGCEHD